MPKKPAAKKALKKKATKSKVVPMTNSERKSVNITKASNGYIVSTYTDTGEKTVIAKTKVEAKKQANKMLDI